MKCLLSFSLSFYLCLCLSSALCLPMYGLGMSAVSAFVSVAWFSFAAVAFAMIFYFSLLSCQTWGTEREWAVATLVTMSMAIVDLVTAGWGMFVLVTSSQAIFVDEDTPEGCDDWKAYFFYYAAAVVITAHVTVAVSCATVSVFLTRGVANQLEELRHLV